MQNPKLEIPAIISTLTSTTSAAALDATLTRYFTPDARFLHPLCAATTRSQIHGVYRWYRVMSPTTKSDVLTVVYDPDLDVLFVEVVQRFHIRFNPFKMTPARLNVRLTLREVCGLHYIVQQEDFYHPTDIAALTLPPLIPLVRLILTLATLVSGVCAWLFCAVGFTGGGLEGGDEGARKVLGGIRGEKESDADGVDGDT